LEAGLADKTDSGSAVILELDLLPYLEIWHYNGRWSASSRGSIVTSCSRVSGSIVAVWWWMGPKTETGGDEGARLHYRVGSALMIDWPRACGRAWVRGQSCRMLDAYIHGH
jgi:hypothetical protein